MSIAVIRASGSRSAEWYIHHIYLLYGAQAAAAQWAATFKDFPPVQKPNTFTLDDALRMMHETASGMH